MVFPPKFRVILAGYSLTDCRGNNWAYDSPGAPKIPALVIPGIPDSVGRLTILSPYQYRKSGR